jgi:hypothetical protein
MKPHVLIPAVAAICLVGIGVGALIENSPSAFVDGCSTIGVVVSSGSCYRSVAVELVSYAVNGIHYRIINKERCDAVGSEVSVSYLPRHPADGRVTSPPSVVAAYVLFSLAGLAIAVGIGLSLREDHVRRHTWRLLHHYATGKHPFG